MNIEGKSLKKNTVFIAIFFLAVAGCKGKKEVIESQYQGVTDTSGVLKIEDVKAGVGRAAENGEIAIVHYTGTLESGEKFDSSFDRNQPFQFTIGAGQVIKGWDQGILGMKEGGIRKLIIPSHLGYGRQGYPKIIPPNATLHFEIQLLEVKPVQ